MISGIGSRQVGVGKRGSQPTGGGCFWVNLFSGLG